MRSHSSGLFVAVVLLACTSACSSTEPPQAVSASIYLEEADPSRPVLVLDAAVGGGCNVDRTYEVEVEIDRFEGGESVRIVGHDYRSDGGECADLASARAEVLLSPVEANAPHSLELILGDSVGRYSLTQVADGLEVREIEAGIVSLICAEPPDVATDGCLVSPVAS